MLLRPLRPLSFLLGRLQSYGDHGGKELRGRLVGQAPDPERVPVEDGVQRGTFRPEARKLPLAFSVSRNVMCSSRCRSISSTGRLQVSETMNMALSDSRQSFARGRRERRRAPAPGRAAGPQGGDGDADRPTPP